MKKLAILTLMIAACATETYSDTSQQSVDPQACPQNSECEDNRIDAAAARAESEARRRASAAYPGDPQSVESVSCHAYGPLNDRQLVCEVHINVANVRVNFRCDLTYSIDSGGAIILESGMCIANPRAVDPSACPQNSECEDNRIDIAAERSESEARSRARAAYPGVPQSASHVSCKSFPMNRTYDCDVYVELPLVSINFSCTFYYSTDSSGALHLYGVDCIANPR